MPAIEHVRHEMFCHFIARGNPPVISYVAAGYQRNEDAAILLMNIPAIADRIAELIPTYHEMYRSRVSPRTIMKQRREEENACT